MSKLIKKAIVFLTLSILTCLFILYPNLVLSARSLSTDSTQTVERQNMVKMELRLENEYEQFFGRKLQPNNQLDDIPKFSTNIFKENNIFNQKNPHQLDSQLSAKMIENLANLDQKIGTKSVVIWVMPKDKFLRLVLLNNEGKITIKEITDLPANKLRKIVEDFYLEINELNNPMDLTQAQQLYQWILTPFEEEVLIPQQINNILFCFGKGVRLLPFAALHDGKQFAMEKYNMSTIPAFNLINPTYKSLKTPKVLAMGASYFSENEPLPGVGMELQNIVEQLQPKTKMLDYEQLLYNQEFTVSNMEKQIQTQPFDIIHLATHADFNPGSPDNSYIQFWDQKLGIDQMSRFNWQTPPELLVLSACNTAIGDENSELSFTGIALQSGVKSALGSLWYVSDLGTLALVSEFYQQLINTSSPNPTKIQSLTTAQNMLLKGEIYFEDNYLVTPNGKTKLPNDLVIKNRFDLSHPFYWAAFTLISSPW